MTKDEDTLESADAADIEENTDEQLWATFEAEESGKTEADPDEGEDEEDAEDPADEDDPDSPSEDEDDSEDDGDAKGDDTEELRAQVDRLQHALNSEKGRTAASRREAEELRRQIAETQKRIGDQGDEDPRKERPNLDAVSEEYGDIVGPLIDEVKALRQNVDDLSSRDKGRLKDLEGRLDRIAEEEEGVFLTEHPDGFDYLREHGKDFREWVEDQPKRIRDIWQTNFEQIIDGTGAAYLLSSFKQSRLDASEPPEKQQQAETSRRRQRQLDGARSTRSGTRQALTADAPPETDDPEAIWNYFERKDRA